MNTRLRHLSLALCVAAVPWFVGGCNSSQPERADDAVPPAESIAPPPQENPEADPSAERVERAAPPEVRPVALGEFEPRDPVAEAATGRLTLEDDAIRGANGAEFVTERIAIVRAGDEYRVSERYADALAVGSEQPVELRRVLEETPPDEEPDAAFCGDTGTGYIALASVPSERGDTVKLIALRGESMPAAAAEDIALCAAAHYEAAR
ncbi:hypothetical protein [Luteimonas suaedae]|uniref:hypothetical protein n=1 Tax=Luteimonas suaedae TaxID=2605430 RepID=UPI0011ED65A6|nr:hypothetical protein [Luteimonas suaedae]